MSASFDVQWKPVEDAHLRALWRAGWRGDARLMLAMSEIGYRRSVDAIIHRRYHLGLVDADDNRVRPPQTGLSIETPKRPAHWSDPGDPEQIRKAGSQLVQAITLYQLKRATAPQGRAA